MFASYPKAFIKPFEDERIIGVDYSSGGIALNDPSKGLEYQYWRASLFQGSVKLMGLTTWVEQTVRPPGVALAKDISLAFDSNMQPTLSWSDGTDSFLYWFNSVSASFEVLKVAGATNCFCRTDDTRDIANDYRDIIFLYRKGNKILFRATKDRYAVEYEIGPIQDDQLILQAGMNVENRFQVQLIWDYSKTLDEYKCMH